MSFYKFNDLKINRKFPVVHSGDEEGPRDQSILSFHTEKLCLQYAPGICLSSKKSTFETCTIDPYLNIQCPETWDCVTWYKPRILEDFEDKTHDLSLLHHGDEKLFDVDRVAVRYMLYSHDDAEKESNVEILKDIFTPDGKPYFTLRSFIEEVFKQYHKDYQYFLPETYRLDPEYAFELNYLKANLLENIVDVQFVY
jgi:hypothetical protein